MHKSKRKIETISWKLTSESFFFSFLKIISAIFKNEIIDAINTNLRDGNKPNKEELLKALEKVDTGNLTVGRPGVSTTPILSTPQGRDRVRAVLTEIGLNEDESRDYLETLTNNINSNGNNS